MPMTAFSNLWSTCNDFIRENSISCAESIYQRDKIPENALELIEKVCEIVGYHDDGE